jgi:predicted house-cleaning noncanonical NTP pyrophosphatase (MazG superfamily)
MASVWRVGFDKLRNSGLPELAFSVGKSVFDRQRRTDDAILALKEKLRHEVAQVSGAETRAELLEELADVLDVVHALAKVRGISTRELEARRRDKRAPQSPKPIESALQVNAGLAVFRPGFSRGLHALRNSWMPAASVAAHGGSTKRAVDAVRFRHGVMRASAKNAAGVANGAGSAVHARRAFAGAVTFFDGAERRLNTKKWRAVAYAPLAKLKVRGPARVPTVGQSPVIAPVVATRAITLRDSRRLPLVLVGSGSSAAVWIVSVTSRVMFRYVVRPYLVRYVSNDRAGSRLEQGSRRLVRLMLPSLTT